MFSELALAQSRVVDALLDMIDVDDWRFAFLHTEFSEDDPRVSFVQGFLVVPSENGGRKAPLSMGPNSLDETLLQLYAAYAESGNGFCRCDLTVEANAEYRFEFDDTPSRILKGQPDPQGKADYAARFHDLAARV